MSGCLADMPLPGLPASEMEYQDGCASPVWSRMQKPPSPSYLKPAAQQATPHSVPSLSDGTSDDPDSAFASSPCPMNQRDSSSSLDSEELAGLPAFLAKYKKDGDDMSESDVASVMAFSTIDDDYPSQKKRQEMREQQSAMLSQRAEKILANAKSQLSQMEGNLRGARDLCQPLTAANLQRASTSYPAPGRFVPDGYHCEYQNRESVAEIPRREPVRPQGRRIPVRASYSSLNQSLRSSRSYDSGMRKESSPKADELREQMSCLRGKISTLRDRAREDSIRRRSHMESRNISPLNNAEAYYRRDSGATMSSMEKSLPRKLILPGAFDVPHEERDDAFDYQQTVIDHPPTEKSDPAEKSDQTATQSSASVRSSETARPESPPSKRAASRASVDTFATATDMPRRSRSLSRSTAVTLKSLLSSDLRTLSQQDQALIRSVIGSLRETCLGLQEQDEDAYECRIYRRRLDEAKRILDG
ncbi:hypothetical protein K470DRAFT_262545 [Piedraia hortae CBS 480.64]|uniref:Uncharacterized protein n=1 Tax=Piedraia hortae CBS 480.64 TaxID=1314780 RepID=A0A6A7C5J9_9PEZI|nr:hypothetical protein K470DRAFT_262545 [Piedraia hortae CBS 480.64]